MAASKTASNRKIVLAALSLAMPAMIACNAIIGLSDFTKGECPGGRCAEAGLPDVVEGGGDSGGDTGVDAKGADPVSWAQWPMPNYGDGGAGDPPRPPKHIPSGDAGDDTDIVTDDVTKLTWRARPIAAVQFAKQADVECRKAPNGPWRAPKRIELVTLLDYARSSAPYIDTTSFKGIAVNEVLWTTSEVRPFDVDDPASQKYWAVDMKTGAVEAIPHDSRASVLCVRAK